MDVRDEVDGLRALARDPMATPPGGWPEGTPVDELTRSPAAMRVGALAARDGLFAFHYEHRAWRELPDDWVPLDRSDLAMPPRWENGVLPEAKYQAFRHDLAVASFNPGHRAKWGAHELAHALVGFAWKPDASPFFLATGARLAELIPVALWYFLDEACLRRCPIHAEEGALFQKGCAACERVAMPDPDDREAERKLVDGRRFLDRELAAVRRSIRAGRPISHAWGTIDLGSDGLAYAGAHGRRLASEAFRRFAAGFLVDGGGMWSTLDDLEARVVEVYDGIAKGTPVRPLSPGRTEGHARWMVQDAAWRLWTVWHETDGDAAQALEAVIDGLAATGDVAAAAAAYEGLHDEWVLPLPEEVFAVGYALPGGRGRAIGQLCEGVRTATPLAADLIGETLREDVTAFAARDTATRSPLGRRFAAWLTETEPGPVADLARYEAAILTSPPGDEVAVALGPVGADARVRLAEGLSVHRFGVDVVSLAEKADEGRLGWDDGALADMETGPIPASPAALVVGRDGRGDLLVLDVSPAAGDVLEALGDGAIPAGLEPGEAQALRDLGVLVPARWPV